MIPAIAVAASLIAGNSGWAADADKPLARQAGFARDPLPAKYRSDPVVPPSRPDAPPTPPGPSMTIEVFRPGDVAPSYRQTLPLPVAPSDPVAAQPVVQAPPPAKRWHADPSRAGYLWYGTDGGPVMFWWPRVP
jgi:hypothetical protein